MDKAPPVQKRRLVIAIGEFFLEFIKIGVVAVLLILLTRHFLFKPFYVKGQSMEPTFQEDDYLIVDELSYRFHLPQRGDVVVLESPSDPSEYYLKRIIGLPGDRVDIVENKLIIYNAEHPRGIVLHEDYLTEITPGNTEITLEPDQYFVMGDNRDKSYDSRNFGPVSKDKIVGHTLVRGFPFNHLSIFHHVIYEQ